MLSFTLWRVLNPRKYISRINFPKSNPKFSPLSIHILSMKGRFETVDHRPSRKTEKRHISLEVLDEEFHF